MAFSEFGRWTERLLADRRSQLPVEYVASCDADIAEGDHRQVAFAIVQGSLQGDHRVPPLTPEELEQARAYNERGAFGRTAILHFRELFDKADRLVSA